MGDAEEEKRYVVVASAWRKGRLRSTARECTPQEREDIERGWYLAHCTHLVTSATRQPPSSATLTDICRNHERLLRAPECMCRLGLRLREALEEKARARPLPVTLVSKAVLPTAPFGQTTELSTKALSARLRELHPGSTWRFFFQERSTGRWSNELSCSGRFLSDLLPPPRRGDTSVTLKAALEEQAVERPGPIRDEDLVGKLVRHTEVPDDPDRKGEKENAKRKLEQFLTKNPSLAQLVPAYRAKLRRRC